MNDRKSLTYLIISAFIWGTSFPVIETILSFFTINFYILYIIRLAIAFLGSLLLITILKRIKLFLKNITNIKLILLGLINAAAFGLQIFGQQFTTAGKTALLIDLNIIFVAILSKIVLKEKLTKFKTVGIILGLIGAYFLTIGFNFQQILLGNIIGDLTIFIAGFIWAFYIVGSRSVLKKDNEKKINFFDYTNIINFYTLIFGLIPLIFMIFINVESLYISNSLILWLLILHLGLNCSFIAFLLFHKGLEKTSSVIASIVLLIEVVTANILGMIFLPHITYFTIDFLIGAIFTILAVISCSLSKPNNKNNL